MVIKIEAIVLSRAVGIHHVLESIKKNSRTYLERTHPLHNKIQKKLDGYFK